MYVDILKMLILMIFLPVKCITAIVLLPVI